jgi:predicted N-formylglutamate amidohydrolase
MSAARRFERAPLQAVTVSNRAGRGRLVIACDHASNAIPEEFGTLGLDAGELERHIAWDPGALPVARIMSSLLDAPLVESGISRLVADCNRPLDAPDLIPEISETTAVAANTGLTQAQRAARVAIAHAPFHDALEDVIEERLRRGMETWVVSVHSFTPVYKGFWRPWEVGIIHDEDTRIADQLIADLRTREPGLIVGRNQPYSPEDRVYYTLERHARARGLACAMIEIRNDEIATTTDQRRWGDLLAQVLSGVVIENEREAYGA